VTIAEGCVVGIDLGGTKIRGGIATSSGEIIAELTVPTSGSGLIHQIVALVQELCAAAAIDADHIVATGIGGAGVPDPTGEGFDKAPNLIGVQDVSFAGELALALGHSVVIENDVNVAALGELHYGAGLSHKDFVFISAGTGIGMGIVSAGTLLRGAHGAAGEIGFLPIGSDPLDPANRRRGPLEEMVAGDALTRRYAVVTNEVISSQEVFLRAEAGDPAAIATVNEHAKWIAIAIVTVAAVLDPEIFVLGGGIGSRKELLRLIFDWLARLGNSVLDVRISELGNSAPVAGAVRLALDSTKSFAKGNPHEHRR